MSRCFPFPPPGYEKKLKVEDVTLLAKEKGKEKKEKKHKKDKSKERKEGREKDKERSKEKRKEKDKTKDRDKKNDKKQSQNEKRLEADKPTVEKMGSNSPQSPSGREHEQRISFVDGATGSKTVIGVYDRDQGKTEVLDGLDNRTNGAYCNGGKGGRDQLANVQMGSYQSKSQKVESNFSYEKNQNSNRKADKSKNPLKETALVQDLHRRIRDENGATSSQGNSKTEVTIQKRAQISGGVSNGNVICFPQTKENSRSRNDNYRLENGQKDDIQSKVPRLAIVHNFKAEERGNEMAGVVDLSKKSGMEGLERSKLCGKGGVDNRKNDQFMDVDRNKSKKEERLKEDAGNVHCRSAENGGDSIDNSKHYIFKMGNKITEVTPGKRKEPEANGILHDNETRPEKIQRTVLSSQHATATENGRNSRTGTSITLSTSKQTQINGVKLDGNGHKSNRTMGAQSPQVSTKSPSLGVKPIETMKPSISAKANGNASVQGSPFGLKRPPPPSMSATEGKGNGSIATQGSPLVPTNPPTSIRKFQGTVGSLGSPHTTTKADIQETADIRESAKPALIAGKVNGVIGAHGSPVILKSQSHSGKEKRKDKSKSSSKPRRPHPDTEYLSQILSVPKLEELPELDDLEWLSGSKKCPLIEGEVAYSEGEGEHVWSKAVHIESADIYALPYVIPY